MLLQEGGPRPCHVRQCIPHYGTRNVTRHPESFDRRVYLCQDTKWKERGEHVHSTLPRENHDVGFNSHLLGDWGIPMVPMTKEIA